MKTTENYFNDWEASAFGYGYGSGEEFIFPAIKSFFEACPAEGNYDHKVLEEKLTPTVAWLLINAFCKCDLLEYGTSPRFGWLTNEGHALKNFVSSKTEEELYECKNHDEGYYECYPDRCNCEEQCHNPFWKH